MRNFKKYIALIVAVLLAVLLVACANGEPTSTETQKPGSETNSSETGSSETNPPESGDSVSIHIDDVTMTVGDYADISYTVTPIGTASVVEFTVTDGASFVEVANGKLHALGAGEAIVKAVATNVAGAEETFTAETTFRVTVTDMEREEGNLILNSGFENDFYGWTLVAANPASSFKTEVTNNTAHGGECALNLWSGIDGSTSDALDLTISQDVNVTEAGDYLFSLWLKGKLGSVELTVKSGDTTVASGAFAYADIAKYAMPDEAEYIHVGIELKSLAAGTYHVSARFVDEETGNWGFADDVRFGLGTAEDLVRPEIRGEEVNYNFVKDGDISIDWAESWTVGSTVDFEIGTSQCRRTGDAAHNHVEIYMNNFTMYQQIDDLPVDEDFTAVWWVRSSGEADYTEQEYCRFFIKDARTGLVIWKYDFELPNYSWTRYEFSDLRLPSSVIIGIEVKFAGEETGWANFGSFSLFADGYEPTEEDKPMVDAGLVNGDFNNSGYTAEGWTTENLTESCLASGSKHGDSGRGLKAYGTVVDKSLPVTLMQNVSGFKVGDLAELSAWLATRVADTEDKLQSCEALKLVIGAQEFDVFDTLESTSAWQQVVASTVLTAADFNEDGTVTVGIVFKVVNAEKDQWLDLDDIVLKRSAHWVDVTEVVNANFNEQKLNDEGKTTGAPAGWTTVNLKEYCTGSESKGARSGRHIYGYSGVEQPGIESSVMQTVNAGFKAGDVIRVSAWVGARIEATADKEASVTSVKLYAGAQEKELLGTMKNIGSYQYISFTLTLTEEDIVDGAIQVGVGFTMVEGGWFNLDDFLLEKIG